MREKLKKKSEIFSKFFLVSGKSHSDKKCKRGLWEFLNIHSFAKKEKIEGGPFGDIEKVCEKSLTKLKYPAQKIFGQGRDSNPRPSAWQASKKA